MLLNARGDGKDIGVKDDVFRWETNFLGQDAVGALGNFHFARNGVGLAFFVKSHDDDGGAVAAGQARLLHELLLRLLSC